jgi:hypothetical protein
MPRRQLLQLENAVLALAAFLSSRSSRFHIHSYHSKGQQLQRFVAHLFVSCCLQDAQRTASATSKLAVAAVARRMLPSTPRVGGCSQAGTCISNAVLNHQTRLL